MGLRLEAAMAAQPPSAEPSRRQGLSRTARKLGAALLLPGVVLTAFACAPKVDASPSITPSTSPSIAASQCVTTQEPRRGLNTNSIFSPGKFSPQDDIRIDALVVNGEHVLKITDPGKNSHIEGSTQQDKFPQYANGNEVVVFTDSTDTTYRIGLTRTPPIVAPDGSVIVDIETTICAPVAK